MNMLFVSLLRLCLAVLPLSARCLVRGGLDQVRGGEEEAPAISLVALGQESRVDDLADQVDDAAEPMGYSLAAKIAVKERTLKTRGKIGEGLNEEARHVLKRQAEALAYEWQAHEELLREARKSLQDGRFECPSDHLSRDGQSRYNLSQEEFRYARCPPGVITGMAQTSGLAAKNATLAVQLVKRRMTRLRDALCAAKARGWVSGNAHEGAGYKETGYATFESSVWPKRKGCAATADEEWARSTKIFKRYRPDKPPKWMGRMVNKEANLEFRSIWKVASTSFPEYLRCRFNGDWETELATDDVKPGRPVVTVVRNPISRFVSASGELLQRSVNRWCPNGPCTSNDGFDVNATVEKLQHQTTWYKLFSANATRDSEWLHLLMRSMVSDTGCNYYTYAAEHLSTQSNFFAQNAGQAIPMSAILKLNEGSSQPANINRLWQLASKRVKKEGTPGKSCLLQHRNTEAEKPRGDMVPSSSEMMEALEKDEFLMRDLCLIYAQDFVCFNFPLPKACEGMF